MKKLMLANEAIARGAYEAGVKVVSAYPGTPSTEIAESVAKYPEVYAEWAPNEKVAMEAAFGAALSGRRSFCSMKHVGLNVAADPPISPKNRSGSPIITRRINRISTQGDTGLYSIRDTVHYLFSEDIDSLVKPNETLISFKVPFI